MRRRFQFRLLTLAVITTLVCLGLGSWNLYLAFFGPYVEVSPVAAGETPQARGRLFWIHGKESMDVRFTVFRLLDDGKALVQQDIGALGRRVGLWSYEVEKPLFPISTPGKYRLELTPAAWPGHLSLRDLPVVRSEMIVLPKVADDAIE